MKLNDLTNQKFGRLTVLERAKNNKTGQAYWFCSCECGKEKTVRGSHLTGGASTSCGCKTLEATTKHGKCRSVEYRAYYNMIKRCEYVNDNRYEDYGGRGIRVCPEWRASFEKFFEDMGPRPSNRYSIDRIDVNGNYEPTNCRWASIETQERNKRVRRDSQTGVRGVVVAENGKYIAQIHSGGKTKRIGTFKVLSTAKDARKKAEKKHWSDYE